MLMLSDNKELTQLAKICSKLETFVKFVLQAEPTGQQLEIIKAIDNNEKRIAVKSGHGVGKSCLLSWLSIWILITKEDAKIPITAPSSPQLLATLMPEIKKWVNRLPMILKSEFDFKLDMIRHRNDNFAVMRTARKEEPEALQGFHAKSLVYLVDEGSGVDSEIFEVIEGALTGSDNMLITMGNPTRTSGYFFDAFNKNKELFKTFTLNAEKSPNVSKEAIAKARKMYGEDSDAYRVRVLGEFPRASSDALFSVEELDNAMKRDVKKEGSEIWGLDVAEFGDDNSVLCKRKGFFIRPLVKYSNLDTEGLSNLIALEYSKAKEKPVAIYIDVIGIGAGVWSNLTRKGLPAYRGDVRVATYVDGLFNKRIEIYHRLRDRLNLLSLPDDDELYGELGALRYEITEKGKIKLESKKDTKRRLGRSPDKGDALALTFYDEIDEASDEFIDYDNPRLAHLEFLNSNDSDIAW